MILGADEHFREFWLLVLRSERLIFVGNLETQPAAPHTNDVVARESKVVN